MEENVGIHMPEKGAVFTFGRSRFADNTPSYFYIRNDPVLEVACGDEHTAVICQKGRVFVFGNNDYGQLGLGHRNVTVKPSCVKSLKPEKATHVACGRAHTVLSTSSGKIYSWGSNSDGQLGVGDTADRLAPTRVMGIQDDVVQLSAGCVSSVALTSHGQVYVWGSNSDGQLGLADTNDILRPVLLSFDHQIDHISCGYYHTAFVTDSGALYTCGESESGKLGLPDSLTNITSPQKVPLGLPVKYAFCGGSHTVALTADGEVFGFGNNFSGQLGLGADVTQSILPTRIISFENNVIINVACGESHTAFVTDRGFLYTCGEGRHGKLCTDQDNNNCAIPVKVTRFKGFTVQKVACGGCHTMVLANKKQGDEDELDLLSDSLDVENRANLMPAVSNPNALPPLQHVRIQSLNNNTAFTACFQENQNNNLEELQDEPTDVMVIEKDLEEKSTLSGSKESSDEDGIDADVDEEMSPNSTRPEKGERDAISNAVVVTETSDVEEDDIKNIDDKSEEDNDCEQGGDSTDVKIESEEKKEGRVARFFSAFRRKKPSSVPSIGFEGCGEQPDKDSCHRAASKGRVWKEEHTGGDSGRSKNANLGNEIQSKACTLL